MENGFFFTCQIEPVSISFLCSDFKKSKKVLLQQIIRISCAALLFIMSITFLSTISAVYSASKKNETYFDRIRGSTPEALPAVGIKNTISAANPIREKPVMKKGFPVEQFPVYIPFYFFILGFFLVLAQHWILVKGGDAADARQTNEHNKSCGPQENFIKNQRKIQLEGSELGRKTLISVPTSN